MRTIGISKPSMSISSTKREWERRRKRGGRKTGRGGGDSVLILTLTWIGLGLKSHISDHVASCHISLCKTHVLHRSSKQELHSLPTALCICAFIYSALLDLCPVFIRSFTGHCLRLQRTVLPWLSLPNTSTKYFLLSSLNKSIFVNVLLIHLYV